MYSMGENKKRNPLALYIMSACTSHKIPVFSYCNNGGKSVRRKGLRNFIHVSCRNSVWILAFCWVFGICLGLLLGFVSGDLSFMMRRACYEPVSIVRLLPTLLFQVALSAVAALFFHPRVFYLFSLGKGLSYGFCMYMIIAEFTSAGWLLFGLLSFSDGCLLISLFSFWIHQIGNSKQEIKRDIITCLVVALAATFADYYVISPLIVTSMNHL